MGFPDVPRVHSPEVDEKGRFGLIKEKRLSLRIAAFLYGNLIYKASLSDA
jgi:hypothetical protein